MTAECFSFWVGLVRVKCLRFASLQPPGGGSLVSFPDEFVAPGEEWTGVGGPEKGSGSKGRFLPHPEKSGQNWFLLLFKKI